MRKTFVQHRLQFWIGAALTLLLITTRGHHFPTLNNVLPSASWAVFFLAGMYVRAPVVLGVLLAVSAMVDYAAVVWGGVSSFCVSPAYVALVPAYGALWFAGRRYAMRNRAQSIVVIPLVLHVAVAAVLCELISSGSFYVFSGRFTDLSLSEFGVRFARYFPASLWSMWFWIVAAASLDVIAATLRGDRAISLLKR